MSTALTPSVPAEATRPLEVVGELSAEGQLLSPSGAQPELTLEALGSLDRKLGRQG